MVLKRILKFCERYEKAGTKVAFFLIALQLVHLVWLTTDIVLVKLLPGQMPLFPRALEPVQAVIDYLEIPGLFAAVTIYVMGMVRTGRISPKNALLTALLLVQFVHLFWITDEVVYEVLLESDLVEIPAPVAWVAIMIDYLELPVIFDLFKRVSGKKK
ncbi:MAG: hypothetical protein HY833_03005 [Candidatus Aenigmarchaeota archaeon]|nr:hypothetical protein [Candidatus Aenigmarchaeota archaeon]